MKKIIKIAHLYYDLLNLYGESGNVRILKKFCEQAGAETEVHFLTIGDKIDFKKYDFYYIGAGSEENQLLVIKNLLEYKDDIKKAIEEDGKFFLATGNAMEYFGRKIRKRSGIGIDCLNIFDYHAFEEKTRLVSDIFDNIKILKDKGNNFVAFKNCACNIINNKDNRLCEYADSFYKYNFYGMNFIGPVLVRNPYFTRYLVEKLFEQKEYDICKILDNSIEFKAYNEFVENFVLNREID